MTVLCEAGASLLATTQAEPTPNEGCVAIAEDVSIENAGQIFDDFRLDYDHTPFAKDKGFAVIEYDNPANSGLVNAFESDVVKGYGIPQTQTGMLGSHNKIIPEYYQTSINLEDEYKATLKIFNAEGNIIETYKLNKKTWKKEP